MKKRRRERKRKYKTKKQLKEGDKRWDSSHL